MLLSVTFDAIATLVWNLYWAHTFVARWIRYSCVYFYLWPFRFVAVSVCSRSGLWPFRSVAVSVCGRSGLWPFRFVAVSVCGRFGLWPFRFVAVSVCGRFGFGRFGLWPLWPESMVVIMIIMLAEYSNVFVGVLPIVDVVVVLDTPVCMDYIELCSMFSVSDCGQSYHSQCMYSAFSKSRCIFFPKNQSEKTPHTSSERARYGVSFVSP